MKRIAARPVDGVDVVCTLGESPFWDWRERTLRWVDLLGGVLHELRSGRPGVRSLRLGSAIGFARPHAGGGIIAVADNRVLHLSQHGEVRLAELPVPPYVRMNDGAVDPSGRLWVGTTAWDHRVGAGALFVWDGHPSMRPVLQSLTISNGLDWGSDPLRPRFVDSAAGSIDELVLGADGLSVTERRPLIEIAGLDGVPDGITIDSEDSVWVALWGGGEVRCYDVAGLLRRVVELPVAHVTSCCFGGDDFATLFITTACPPGATADAPPGAGRLFACRPGVRGVPSRMFGCESRTA